MARLMIFAGVFLIVGGIILKLAPWAINWFGNLPGDIKFESEKSRVFIPVTSMIILSVVLSIIVNIFRK